MNGTMATDNGLLITPEQEWIAQSLQNDMPPAHRMGIQPNPTTVVGAETNDDDKGTTTTDEIGTDDSATQPQPPSRQQQQLSLRMPLEGNTNVHGTAFAGSLYSLVTLTAWYLVAAEFRQRGWLNQKFALVLKSAEIDYRKPIRKHQRQQETQNPDDWIVATCTLDRDSAEWKDFLDTLQTKRKATLVVRGIIPVNTNVNNKSSSNNMAAVEYSAVLCALEPKQYSSPSSSS